MPNYLLLLFIFICWNTSLTSQEYQSTKINQQKISVLDKRVEFSGWHGAHKNINDVDEIRIGLFLPTLPNNEFNSSINKAADLAIKEINEAGGYKNIPYRLIRRWSYDPWGSGSKEMIKLIYEDSVWAVIGSLNGEATHVAEQIATKAWVPLISPISADPTLNYIRIPWIFRLPPNYQTQSEFIIFQAIKERALTKIGLISTTSHDGRIFAKEIQDELKKRNHSLIFHLQASAQQPDLSDIVDRALNFSPDGLILFLTAQEIVNFISKLHYFDCKIPVFTPWIPEFSSDLKPEISYKKLYSLHPFSIWHNSSWDSFQKRYKHHYYKNPSAVAAMTYDAIYLLVHAIEKAGLNRPAIRDAIAQTDYLSPVSGKISWDNVGGNMAQPVLLKMFHR